MQFVECDTCNAKPGSPQLCVGCLQNRKTIEILRKKSYYDDWQESKRQLEKLLDMLAKC